MVTLLAGKMLYEDMESPPPDSSDAAGHESNQPAAMEANTVETKSAPLGDDTAKNLVQLFKLLADETRLRILHFLMQQEELNVRTLCELLEQSQPAVSHHLALLRGAGVIECRRDGKHNFYHLVPRRCQHYLDLLFANSSEANSPDHKRRIRIEDSVLTYGRSGQLGA